MTIGRDRLRAAGTREARMGASLIRGCREFYPNAGGSGGGPRRSLPGARSLSAPLLGEDRSRGLSVVARLGAVVRGSLKCESSTPFRTPAERKSLDVMAKA